MSRQIILDTETTGLIPEEGHRIIEIGCLELINRKITGSTFHRYINPNRNIESGAEQVHGITLQFLMDKPVFSEIIQEFLDYVQDAELIIHNAPFDIGFLNHEIKLCGKNFKAITEYCSVVDTLALARRKHPGQHNNLDALCRRYRVDNSNRELHGALKDSELLAKVYLLMTGGQTQLFQETGQEPIEVGNHTDVKKTIRERKPLPIIYPTPEELAAHAAYLELIRKKGRCVWQDDT